jgi:nucleotide-binding universal stress UspA family protein
MTTTSTGRPRSPDPVRRLHHPAGDMTTARPDSDGVHPAGQAAGLIVVGVDGSAHSQAVMHWAVTEAARRQAALIVCHVAVKSAAGTSATDSVLADAVEQVRGQPTLAVYYRPLGGRPAEQLVQAAASADLLVVGAPGRAAVGTLLHGSVSEQVVREAPCPVIVVRDITPDSARQPRVVVGVDGSADAELAIEFAFDEAARRGITIHAIHAFDPGAVLAMPYLPEDMLNGLRESTATAFAAQLTQHADAHPDVDVSFEMVHGSAASILLEESAGADLLVLGSHRHSNVATRLLGSTSSAALHHALCLVAIVHRQPGGPTPARE